MENRYRLPLLFLASLILGLGIAVPANAQNITVAPPQRVNQSGQPTGFQFLFKADEPLLLVWDVPLATGQLKIGTAPGQFNLVSLPVSGNQALFRPADLGLGTGSYYAIITNASGNTLSAIQQQASSNSAVLFTAQIRFAVEALTAPSVLAPQGTVTDPTPVFEWEAVPGVIAYFIVVSSTPFELDTDPVTDEIVVRGATAIWQTITTTTSLRYGEIIPNPQVPSLVAPPLSPGNEYSFTILNVYDELDPNFTSDVFGTVNTFIFEGEQTVTPPELTAPSEGASFFAEPRITFSWDPVEDANDYTFFLFERRNDGSSEIDFPVSSQTTTATVVDYAARANLRTGTYVWYVVANDEAGAGASSESRRFTYEAPMGDFTVSARSADGQALVGVDVRVRSLDGGFTPLIPFNTLQSSTVSDSLVAGLYEFEATKSGYADTTVVQEIIANQQNNVRVFLRLLPSSISGVVQNDAGNPISAATVTFTNTTSGNIKEVSTGAAGTFSAGLSPGTYSVKARKVGFQSSSSVIITVAERQQREIAFPLVLRDDAARLSGRVLNSVGSPIQRATVRAQQGDLVFQTQTTGSGDYSFTLTSGAWLISASREGFVSPSPLSVSLSKGDNLQSQNITLIGRANQVSGTVQEILTRADGTRELAFLQGATVTATPLSGSAVRATTNLTGEFTLNLGRGTYTLRASANGFSLASDPVTLDLTVAETLTGINFQLRPNTGSVAGLVSLIDGSEVADATVRIAGVGEVRTTASGAYNLRVPPGTHTLAVFKAGLVAPAPQTLVVNVGANVTGVDFTMLPDAASISGTVRSAGQAIVDATITATNGALTFTTTSDAVGAFELSVPAGTWTLNVSRAGFASSGAQVITVGAGQESVGNSFELTNNTARVEGFVVNANVPINNVAVVLTAVDDASNSSTTFTRSDGSFAARVTAGTAYRVTASVAGFRTLSQQTETLAAGAQASLTFNMAAAAASVSGTVRAISGEPLGAAKVVAAQDGVRTDSTFSDINGTYRLGLNAASTVLEVQVPGYATGSRTLNLNVGQNVSEVDFQLDENFATLTGTIRSRVAGAAIEGVTVRATSDLGGGSGQTAADGTYIIPQLVEGLYTVRLERNGFADTTLTDIDVPAGEDVSLNRRMTRAEGQISGMITNNSGTPISGATVTIVSPVGEVLQTLTGSDGTYSFSDLRLGNYTVTASRAGFQSAFEASVTLDATTQEGTANITDLVRNTSVLTGQVTDAASGAGLLGVRVALSGEAGSASAITNTDGTYRIENLAPGTYAVAPTLTGFSGASATAAVANLQTTTQDLTLAANNGQITGRVTDQSNNALGFPVTVRATWQDLVFTVQSNANGNFTIEEIAPGRTYIVTTEIFEEGFVNGSATVEYPQDAPTLTVNLAVTANTAQITGNAGTSQATVQAITNGTVVASATSASDGAYRIRLLPAGSYEVRASRQGFSFNPATRSVSLSVGGSGTANFTASSNVGTLAVNTQTSSGAAQAGVSISAISTDNTVTRTGVTGSNGRFTFANLPGGRTYSIQATLDGFTANPATRQVTLGAGQQQTTSFTMVPSTAVISGTVRNTTGAAVTEANVRAEDTATGRSFRATTAANGSYSISNLPAGQYEVVATKAGFQPGTLSVTLGEGEQKSGQNLTVSATTVTITGSVLFAGAGVTGITVTATSTVQLTTQTNSSGRFTFTNVPITPEASDTTAYQIRISAADIATQQQVIRIPGSQAGQQITVPAFTLPSGQIVLSFTDGIDPLEGVAVTFTPPNGSSQSITTDETGAFTSSNRLGRGTYRVTASRAGFLTPSAEDLRLILENNEQRLTRTIPLPYLHTPPETISASRDANLSVRFRQGFSPSNGTARIFFRRASQSTFTEVAMARQDTSFTGTIPAQRSLEPITYFVQVDDSGTGITYASEQFTFEPLAEGILTTAAVSPGINGVRLRQGDTYRLTLAVRDGINDGLTDQFVGGNATGTVTWTSSDDAGLSVAFPESNNPTVVDVIAAQAGSYTLRIVTTLSGVRLVSEAALEVVNTPIEAVTATASATRLSNTSDGVQINYGVVDTSGASVLIGGSNVAWSLSIDGVATIDEQGLLVPTDASYIGPIGVTFTDVASGLSASTEVAVFANVDGSQAYTLVDNQGMSIVLPQGSVPFPAEVGLIDGRAEGSKKRVFPAGSSDTYTVSDRIYRFTFRSDQALPGDSLVVDAQLTLPVDPSLRLHEGGKAIGVFEPSTIQWTLVSGGGEAFAKTGAAFQDGPTVSTQSFRKVGEYAILTQNQPLGIQHLSVLPSPFSPDTGPVKIGYFLNTSDPPANVTIRIFNIRGELVRTLLDNDPQAPGRYGSRTGEKEISWDGLTDDGTLARNGRYIIQVKVEDSTGEETEIIPVVLIK